MEQANSPSENPHKRRIRYSGKNPRRFEEKYKELDPDRDPDTIAKVIASGKTPAGQHRPILVDEILQHLAPRPGQRGADVTFGYGGHMCLGQHLAVLEVEMFFRELLPRLEHIEMAGNPDWVQAVFVGGLKSMPVRYRFR